ncbi:MAG: sigma-70 family RNA polymerase sigma factor [Chloroflexi bacterium]|nr:MAG: sigma-70 family RNA polymerase sigma factor [Chloroflexota bacterium]
MNTYDDEPDLLARTRKGDLDAFNSLVERFQSPVYSLCLRMLASPPAAEDAAQEAFISAFRSINSFRGGSFRAWLFRIAANACYDEIRRRRSRRTRSLDEPRDDDTRPIDVADPAPALDERAEAAELGAFIQDALSRLPSDQRLAVILCDVQGLDYAEIAEATAASLGTVKSRISRGRANLRVLLRAGGELLPTRFRQASEGQNDATL